jgi:flavoprotein
MSLIPTSITNDIISTIKGEVPVLVLPFRAKYSQVIDDQRIRVWACLIFYYILLFYIVL